MSLDRLSDLVAAAGISALLLVSLSIVLVVSRSKRRFRAGITMVPAWCGVMFSFYFLRLTGHPLEVVPESILVNYAVGMVVISWAMLDVSRLARVYFTTSPLASAEAARSFLHAPSTREALWSAFVRALPVAAWVKSKEGMLVVNQAYVDHYGKPADEYVGNQHDAAWEAPVASRLTENDQLVMEGRKPHVFLEVVPVGTPNYHGTYMKFPIVDIYGKNVIVGGIEIGNYSFAEQPGDSNAGPATG